MRLKRVAKASSQLGGLPLRAIRGRTHLFEPSQVEQH